MVIKQRLDVLIMDRGLVTSREKARAMIMAGEVFVNGHEVNKPGTQVSLEVEILIKNQPRFVSRGGDKLEAALQFFQLDTRDRIAADVGASTGGFTDCLIHRDIKRVYAIDVGYGQLDYMLRLDKRVIVMERTNARRIEALPESVNLVVIDASFISLKLLLPVIQRWLLPQADVVPLIKPQFEAGRHDVGKGGVVRNSQVHQRVLKETLLFARQIGFTINGLVTSPLKGPAGNIEFLAWLRWDDTVDLSTDIEALVDSVI